MSFCTWKLHEIASFRIWLKVSFQGCSGWWEIHKAGLSFPFGTNQSPLFCFWLEPKQSQIHQKNIPPLFHGGRFDQIQLEGHGKRTCEVDFRVWGLEIWGQIFELVSHSCFGCCTFESDSWFLGGKHISGVSKLFLPSCTDIHRNQLFQWLFQDSIVYSYVWYIDVYLFLLDIFVRMYVYRYIIVF